jgi:energy-coupling factor transporter ATP-binding protein EcfA2
LRRALAWRFADLTLGAARVSFLDMAATLPASSDPPSRTPIDARLLQWFAVELILDSRARLVEGGAGGDTRIDLADVFVDLPASSWCGRDSAPSDVAIIRWICQEPAPDEETERRRPRAVIIGGPGTGKSTATTIVAQLLRLEQLRSHVGDLPIRLQERVREVATGLDGLRARIGLTACRELLPLRVNLPDLARLTPASPDPDPAGMLWRYLSNRIAEHAAGFGTVGLTADDLERMARANPAVLWIFDGLDEVPHSAGRDHVIAMIRAATGRDARQRVVVTTRPQGYDGEFGDLDSLVLSELPPPLALDYGLRLLRAWSGNEDPQLNEKLASLTEELEKPDVQALVRTPLHTTMATLLVAEEGTLPSARHLLFEHYFDTIFKRELRKRGEHRVRSEDKARLKTLHARAGLALHVRSQDGAGARPMLATRELRAILETILREEQQSPEDVQAIAERMLRFAADRLVLLLRVTDGGYSFSVRSLQEFFAGMAIRDGDTREVRQRLDIIALNPHWSNVLSLIVSWVAVSSASQREKIAALEYTQGLCRALNDGTVGGRAPKECVAGSRLAIAMLREIERYGRPWLLEPLWSVALEAASSSLQTKVADNAWIPSGRGESGLAQWDDDLEVHARLGALAIGWKGDDRERWLPRVLELASGYLNTDDGSPRAWLLLLEALQQDDARAVAIAARHAPKTSDAARRLLDILIDWRTNTVAPWINTFASNHPAWFPPDWLISRSPLRHDLHSEPGIFALWQLSSQQPRNHRSRIRLHENWWFTLCSLESATGIWAQVTLPIVSDSQEWSAWNKLATFHAKPSADCLADALEAIAMSGALDRLMWKSTAIAWPVRNCLDFVFNTAELRTIVAAVRAGELGNLEDWQAAEARWRTSPALSNNEFSDWLSARRLPWPGDIAMQGRAFSLDTVRAFGTGVQLYKEEISRSCAIILNGSFRNRPLAWLCQMLLGYARSLDGEDETAPTYAQDVFVPLEIVSNAPNIPDKYPYRALYSIDIIVPGLAGSDAEAWYNLLDQRGRRGLNRVVGRRHGQLKTRLTNILEALISRISRDASQWGLVDAVSVVLTSIPTASLAGLRLPPLPPEATPRVRACAAMLSVLDPDCTIPDVQTHLAALHSKEESFDLRPQLVSVLEERDENRARATELLLQLLDTTTGDEERLRDAILGGLFQHLKHTAPPAFATAEAWRQCNLPEPFLSGQAPDVQPPRMIQLAELSNIRLFKNTPAIDAPFPQPDADQGQWIVVVGENGVGKTTLLRAIGLALAGPTVATRLLDESQPFVRNGGDGRIAIELDTGLVEIVVRRDARTEMVLSAGDEKATRPWVVGYGVRRGTARGEKDRTPEWGPTGELHTLFDRPATLVNAVDWLLDLDRRRLNEERQFPPGRDDQAPRGHAATWQSVERALNALLRITAIEPEDRHVIVTHPELGRVRLDALSDGYLTTTGWVIDLIARWIQRQEDLRETVGRDLLRQMTGVVLIDEIDLHLHPTWQMRIIDDVRRLFPRLSFVVTTHNPLTLHGARPGEIFVMRRSEGGRIELSQRDIQPGHDVDRVLFEQFGIRYTFDHETRVMLERHRALMEHGAVVDEPERLELERALADRLGRVGEVLAEERGEERDPVQRWTDEDRRRFDEYATRKG